MIINGGGAGGTGSDECTARLSDIPAGLKAVTADSNDEAGVGTMTMTGNAQAAHVLAGETFYTNNYKTKLTGTMTVNSLLSFSVAAYSGRRVLAKWQNPNQAAGKPFSGVIIRYSTSGYPGTTGGTQIYKGAGNNTAAGAWSQAYLDLPALSTKYYLSIYPYVTCSAGERTGAVINATVTTAAVINKTFTAGGSYTIPAGYTRMDLFAVGGGSGDSGGNGSTGGGGGYTKTTSGIAISPGQVLAIIVGSGTQGTTAGASSITRSGSVLCNAPGGTTIHNGSFGNYGLNGGSGGGAAMIGSGYVGGAGGTNGGDGGSTNYGGGKGQGTTTRAWGLATGTLYAGGGGGGGGSGSGSEKYSAGGAGGAGGGGRGGRGGYKYYAGDDEYNYVGGENGVTGTANTGGGGGGGGYVYYDSRSNPGSSAKGGSGIVLIKLY